MAPPPAGREHVVMRRATLALAAAAATVLLTTAAAHAAGALNARIAFTSFRDGELGDIWTMNPDGTQLRKLTAGPLYDAQADWSPDGRKLASGAVRMRRADWRSGRWTATAPARRC
jgi:hypothetical protein